MKGRAVSAFQCRMECSVAQCKLSTSSRLQGVESFWVVGSVQEFASCGAASGEAITWAVAELTLKQGSIMKHGYVHREAGTAMHFKATLVSQVGAYGCIDKLITDC